MKKIKLSKGKHAIVDDADFMFLNQWRWHFDGMYARRWDYAFGKRNPISVKMHRLLMDPTETQEVDHINGKHLDNRRKNLRVCSHAENTRNSAKRKTNTSGFKGVDLHKKTGKWRARIRAGRNIVEIGLFKTAKGAHRAYCLAAKEHHGAFARTS